MRSLHSSTCLLLLPPPPHWSTDEDISTLDESLSLFGLSEVQRGKIYEIVAGILHLGNIQFEEKEYRCYIVGDTVKYLEYSAKLLGIDYKILKNSLLERNVSVGTSERSSNVR